MILNFYISELQSKDYKYVIYLNTAFGEQNQGSNKYQLSHFRAHFLCLCGKKCSAQNYANNDVIRFDILLEMGQHKIGEFKIAFTCLLIALGIYI